MIQENPLVTVIALCYNHDRFLDEALQSIVNQDYSNIELIIVDDFSVDNSVEIILKFVKNNVSWKTIFNENNHGNCRSFNKALKIANGKYVIDFSTDDVMLPERVAKQVEKFEKSSDKIGVVYSNGTYIDENSQFLKNRQVLDDSTMPEGDVYQHFLRSSFLIPCTMMIKKDVLDKMGGYDENLAYEDLDFWIRSSRTWEYAYIPEILSFQRIVKGSHSASFYKKHNLLTPSAVEVCKKALLLNKTEEENEALLIRMRAIIIKCVLSENFQAGKELVKIIEDLNGHDFKSWLFSKLLLLKLPFGLISNNYIEVRRFIKFRI
ncbi:MAG: glycosyltransferase [Arcicella sp.]|nr:glycosyltransferase [Arcicella sp.]